MKLPKKLINKYRVFEVSCIAFLFCSMMYMVLPHLKWFNFPAFWDTFFYIKDYLYLIIILWILHTFLVTKFQKLLSASLILFTSERLIFNTILAFLPKEERVVYKQSGSIGIILSIELFVILYLLKDHIYRLFIKIGFINRIIRKLKNETFRRLFKSDIEA